MAGVHLLRTCGFLFSVLELTKLLQMLMVIGMVIHGTIMFCMKTVAKLFNQGADVNATNKKNAASLMLAS